MGACLASGRERVKGKHRPKALWAPALGVYCWRMEGVRQISPDEPEVLAAIQSVLAREPARHLFLLAALEELRAGRLTDRLCLYAAADSLEAAALVAPRGVWIPAATDLGRARALGAAMQSLPLRKAFGDRAVVDAIWQGYHQGRPAPRTTRLQRLLEITADDMGPWVTPELRLAVEADLEPLVAAETRLDLVAVGEDSLDARRQRCLARIRAGRTYVVFDADRLVFKAGIGSRCRYGAQVEGVYTAPAERGKGIATRALGQICRNLLSALPRLTLLADPDNYAALGLYRKLGFGERAELQLVVAGE